MQPLQQNLSVTLDQYVLAIVDAAVTFLVFVIAAGILYAAGRYVVARMVRDSLSFREYDETLIGLAVRATTAIMAVVAIAVAATIAGFGVVLAGFATLAGALALAVGFAARDLLSNFVAGIFILQDKPFRVGDWIEWDGHNGVVQDIQLRVTKINTFDNQQVTVPNSDLANAALINHVANETRRVTVGFGIGYDADISQARSLILEEAAQMDGIIDDPAPSAPVTELGDSAVVLTGRVWIRPAETSAGAIRNQLLEAVKTQFDAHGIDIPYPNRALSGELHVENLTT